jgi:hypothetical protein
MYSVWVPLVAPKLIEIGMAAFGVTFGTTTLN